MEDSFIQAVGRFHELRLSGNERGMRLLLAEIEVPEDEAEMISQRYLGDNTPAPTLASIDAAIEELRKIDQAFMAGTLSRKERGREVKRTKGLFKVLGLEYGWPKYKLYWYFMRHVFGQENFDFLVPETSVHAWGQNRLTVKSQLNDSKGNQLPIILAAAGITTGVSGLPEHVIRKANRLLQKLGNEVGVALISAMFKAKIIFPPDKILDSLATAIKRGLSGETVIITGAFCPDYGYEETGIPSTPYRYTFDTLGSGVGLVAQQFARMLPLLEKFFQDFSIPHRNILAIGDFECNSPEICARVGCDQEEFIRRCAQSLQAFQDELPGIPMELLLFERQLANGRWLQYKANAHSSMSSGNFGHIKQGTGKDPENEISFIANDCRSFYDSWYGKKHQDHELRELVIDQAAEYAAVGWIIAEDFSGQPIIQLAGDRPKMQIFGAMKSGADFPVLCAQRVY